MDELVQRLAQGEHPVIVSGSESAEELQQSIERGYVLVEFTDTQGGTELGFVVDKAGNNPNGASFDQSSGTVHLVGDLTLNCVKARCVADVTLAGSEGRGHLEILEQIPYAFRV